MTSEPPADAPNRKSKSTDDADVVHSAAPPAEPPVAVEYDDFGLPVRKRRPRTPIEDSSDSEADKFEDAVASTAASRDNLTPPDRADETVTDAGTGTGTGASIEKHAPETSTEKAVEAESAEHATTAQPHLNGHLDEADIPQEPKASTPPKAEGDTPKHPKPIQQNIPEITEEQQELPPPPYTARQSATDEPASKHGRKPSLPPVSEYSHQHVLVDQPEPVKEDDEGEWQTMPAYARYDMYDDDNRLIAKENTVELEDMSGYANVGGAAKGYTRVIMDDDADSVTSMDDNTAYLFKEKSTALADEDGEVRDALTQMQTTKNLLTEGQRVAYVGLVRLASIEMQSKFARIEKNKRVKKTLDLQAETTKMWSQKIMVRLYKHMELDPPEQIMIEQLSEHGVVPADLTPALMTNARVRNPGADDEVDSSRPSLSSPRLDSSAEKRISTSSSTFGLSSPPPYEEQGFGYSDVKSPSQLPTSKSLDIDLRWTVLCDLFLVLIADSMYDARSRELFEQVGRYLSVDWLEICRFEKRVTDALEMQEQADKENWNEDDHMETRAKRARNKRLAFMGLATVGGGLVIGLSAGLLAPLIGAGLAAGFTTIGVAGTSSFLAGAGGAAIITSTGVVTGSTVGVRAMNRRTGAVKTFEYRPLHNNKRTNLIITVAGWMNGKVDDVRLPYSTVDPIMGDIYSVLWEPEMLRSMGDTINILATEVSCTHAPSLQ